MILLDINLNTLYVQVQLGEQDRIRSDIEHLNTLYVQVQQL